jgi:hypothetical protein
MSEEIEMLVKRLRAAVIMPDDMLVVEAGALCSEAADLIERLAPTSPTPATREAVARIIDPIAWNEAEEYRQRAEHWAEQGLGDDHVLVEANRSRAQRVVLNSFIKADALIAAGLVSVDRGAVVEECAKVADARAQSGRAERASGGLGQIFANTQDREARDIAAAIRKIGEE